MLAEDKRRPVDPNKLAGLRVKRRSGTCKKYVYATKEEALAALEEIRGTWVPTSLGRRRPRFYYSCPICGEYHLTSKDPREKGKKRGR